MEKDKEEERETGEMIPFMSVVDHRPNSNLDLRSINAALLCRHSHYIIPTLMPR